MSDLTYEDFKQRIDIQELLVDAGYHLNKRDGLRYPSYVRLDSENRRIRGDKFIVTGNGLCCFRPPERKNYNVISFIKEHPDFTAKYSNRDLYDWHHRLTGSCEMGRNAFARENQISLDDSMSVAEFVLLTQNAYGGSTIKKLPEAYRQSKNL